MITENFKIAISLFKRQDFDLMALTDKQVEALKLLHPSNKEFSQILYGGSAGGGKTFLGVDWLLFMCFAYPETRYFIARDQLKQIMMSTYVTLVEVCRLWGLSYGEDYKLDGKYNIIKFCNGSEICLIDVAYKPKDPEFHDLGSTEYTCGFFEEAGGIHREAFKYLNLRVGRWKNDQYGIKDKVLVSANPTKNWLYRHFFKPWKDKAEEKGVKYIQSLPKDNRHLPESYVEKLKNEPDKVKRERLYYGNWDYDDDETRMISDDSITSMFENTHVEGSDKWITADIAYQGSDKYVLFYWEGLAIKDVKSVDKSNGKQVLHILEEYKKRHRVKGSNVIFDADGVGQGLTGHIAGSKEFKANGKAKNQIYKNIKTECAYKFAELVEEGEVWFDYDLQAKEKELLIQDLENLKTWRADEDGKMEIIPKKEWKKQMNGRSPDYFDNFNMRMLPFLKNNRIESGDNFNSIFTM